MSRAKHVQEPEIRHVHSTRFACLQIPVGVSHEEAEGGAPADGGGDDFSIIETTPTSVHTQVPSPSTVQHTVRILQVFTYF